MEQIFGKEPGTYLELKSVSGQAIHLEDRAETYLYKNISTRMIASKKADEIYLITIAAPIVQFYTDFEYNIRVGVMIATFTQF